MKNVLLLSVIAVLTQPASLTGRVHKDTYPRSASSAVTGANKMAGRPNLEGLRRITQLPPNIPQRISGFAYDGKKFWVAIYHGRGRYATFNPLSLGWEASDADEHHKAIGEVAGAFASPGGICFVNDRLWVAGSYGESFGAINTRNWKVERLFKVKYRADNTASQAYASMAYDGSHLWIAWHWFKYKLSVSQTQLLLKVDVETGKVVAEHPAPAGTRNDGVHGLTWDGMHLWHMKDDRLSSVDPSTGRVRAQYTLASIRRASGLAWDGEALWVAEFDGAIWRLPFDGARD